MKRSQDNQINASFIDISRIKWLVFFIIAVSLLPSPSLDMVPWICMVEKQDSSSMIRVNFRGQF